jgi:mannose-1-phosphate guanylyltransferase/mannose-6-phosphate isomerase
MANRWVVVVATGGGHGLADLIARTDGKGVPKALARLGDQQSLLMATLERFEDVAPAARTVVVVPAGHAGRARAQLQGFAPRVLAEPMHRGSGIGVLIALAEILAREPDAEVLITPADHHVKHPAPLRASVAAAFADLEHNPVALIGAVALSAATDRGWLIPGLALPGGGYELSRFVDRPSGRAAHALHHGRAMWSTDIVVARAEAVWRIAARVAPGTCADIAAHVGAHGGPGDAYALASLLESLPQLELVRDLLVRSRRVVIFGVDNSGWCDWSTPERVFVGLGGSPAMEQIMGRFFPEEYSRT